MNFHVRKSCVLKFTFKFETIEQVKIVFYCFLNKISLKKKNHTAFVGIFPDGMKFLNFRKFNTFLVLE